MSTEQESASRGGHFARLPELIPIREEAEPRASPTPTQTSSASQVELQLPPLDQQQNAAKGFIASLGLSAEDERSLDLLLKTVRGEVSATLEELRTVTTHDDNMEKQYKETVSQNIHLQSSLDNAHREIRNLKGKLSVLQMTSSEVRQERARTEQKQRRRAEQEKQVERSRMQFAEEPLPVFSAQERARTVNAKGDYIDYHKPNKKKQRNRRATHPPPPPPPSHPHKGHTPSFKAEPLPPRLPGCSCSACNAKQSLGAVTLGIKSYCGANVHPNQFTKSGQQILLGDRIIVKGEKLGTVCYIGKVDFDVLDLVYIGLHLDKPVGNCDGSVKGRRYFQCPPCHGVFIPPSQVLCVTGRTPLLGGTGLPRVREKLPKALQISQSPSQGTKASAAQDNNRFSKSTSITQSSSHSNSTVFRSKPIMESEIAALKTKNPYDLADDSVARMSEQMRKLAEKSKRLKTPPKEDTPTAKTPPTDHAHSEEMDLPPRPITPTPPSPVPASPPSHPPTPLELTLLQALSEKDLGATGFVTANELASALTQLPGTPLTGAQVEEVFQTLSIDTTEGVGLPYHSLLSLLTQTVSHQLQQLHQDLPP